MRKEQLLIVIPLLVFRRRKDRHEASGFSRRPDPDSDEDEDYERERRKRSKREKDLSKLFSLGKSKALQSGSVFLCQLPFFYRIQEVRFPLEL